MNEISKTILESTDCTVKMKASEYFERIMREGKNIAITGNTGSGKTTFAKALVDSTKDKRICIISGLPSTFADLKETHRDMILLDVCDATELPDADIYFIDELHHHNACRAAVEVVKENKGQLIFTEFARDTHELLKQISKCLNNAEVVDVDAYDMFAVYCCMQKDQYGKREAEVLADADAKSLGAYIVQHASSAEKPLANGAVRTANAFAFTHHAENVDKIEDVISNISLKAVTSNSPKGERVFCGKCGNYWEYKIEDVGVQVNSYASKVLGKSLKRDKAYYVVCPVCGEKVLL